MLYAYDLNSSLQDQRESNFALLKCDFPKSSWKILVFTKDCLKDEEADQKL